MLNLDYVLVGGGLQNALIAEALIRARPGVQVAVVERGPALGGNHTWSFHAADVPPEASFVEPFVVRRWPRYRVRFAALERVLEEPYASLTSASLHAVLSARAERGELALFLNEQAVRVERQRVELSSGRVLEAEVVIDARGPEQFERANVIGYQKFVGLELSVRPGTAPAEPVLMDACVEQADGFRFVYVLPFAEDRILVEDTYFSDSASLDVPGVRARIAQYVAERGIEPFRVLREETGVLPLPGRTARMPKAGAGPLRAGYQGGWLHPTTGYSLPCAVRFAREVARADAAPLGDRLERLGRAELRQQRFATLLNRLLFAGVAPADRHRVLERFYRLPPETIRRFYALTTTPIDRARILCGRPPRGFSLSRMLSARGRMAEQQLQGEGA